MPQLLLAVTGVLRWLCAHGAWAMDLDAYAAADAKCQGTRMQQWQAHWRRMTVEAYQQRGLREPRFDADMVRLLEAVCAELVHADPVLGHDDAVALAERLAGPGGSPDPLAPWALFMLVRREPWQRSNAACNRVNEAFDGDAPLADGKRRYGSFLRIFPEAHRLGTWGPPKDGVIQERALEASRILAKTLSEVIVGGEVAEAPSLLLHVVSRIDLRHQAWGEPMVQSVDAAVAGSSSPGWLKNALRGEIRYENAWAWRGEGWANSVTDAGWRGYSRNLAEAAEFLEQAHREQPQEAYIAVLGMSVAFAAAGSGHRGTDAAAWFDRALSAECDCLEAFEIWNGFHQPRWGGSYEDILALGCDAAAVQRRDTRLTQMLWTGIAAVIEDSKQGGDEQAMQRALAAPRVRLATAKLVQEFRHLRSPAAALAGRWQYCSYLWYAGSRDQARALAAALPADSLRPETERRFHVPVAELLAGSSEVGGGGF